MEEEIKEKPNKIQDGNYITGIIGAIIGGVITTIPWVLVYVYGNMMLSILAVLIAAGEFYGYKLLKGKMSKGVPAILMVIAIIIVTVATLVIIPGLLIQKEGMHVSVDNISKLYQNSEFSSAIMHDFAISIVFTILGASVITANLKKQIANSDGKEIKLDLNNSEEIKERKNAAIELIKPIFTKYDAVNQEKAMMKEEVFAETEDAMAKQQFMYLKQLGIIKKYKGKYYYSEENEAKQMRTKQMTAFIIIGIILVVIAVGAVAMSIITKNIVSDNTITDGTVEFKISDNWEKSDSQYETEWNFYRYISTIPVADTNTIQEGDYSSYPAVINIFYNTVDTSIVSNVENIKTNLQNTFNSTDDKPDEFNIDTLKTEKGYDLVKVRMTYSSDPEEILYYYYILNGDSLACITSYSFTLKDEKELVKQSDKLINSFDWIQK